MGWEDGEGAGHACMQPWLLMTSVGPDDDGRLGGSRAHAHTAYMRVVTGRADRASAGPICMYR